MTHKANYGRTAIAPTTILPELATDLSTGQAGTPNPGQTEVPVHVLPEWAVEFGPTVPALQLRLTLKPGAAPGQVALDLFRLYAAVNRAELGQAGAGLLPGEASADEPTAPGTVSVIFKPADPQGAAQRLAMVVSALQGAPDYPSLEGWEAKVISVAA
jgi:hypothetical protein